MIDASRIHEWSDVYTQMASLHQRDTKMFEVALENFKRVFQRKLNRFGESLEQYGRELSAAKQTEPQNPV